jgi:hypothetical protein
MAQNRNGCQEEQDRIKTRPSIHISDNLLYPHEHIGKHHLRKYPVLPVHPDVMQLLLLIGTLQCCHLIIAAKTGIHSLYSNALSP